MAREKPDKIAPGQLWRFDEDETYVIVRRDYERGKWATCWNGSTTEHFFSTKEIMDDEFISYGPKTAPPSSGSKAADWLRGVAKVLEEKSVSYGDSVGKPMRVFSKAGVTEGIKVRIDDKLSRVARGKEWPGDDVIVDLVGYLALLAVTEER